MFVAIWVKRKGWGHLCSLDTNLASVRVKLSIADVYFSIKL